MIVIIDQQLLLWRLAIRSLFNATGDIGQI